MLCVQSALSNKIVIEYEETTDTGSVFLLASSAPSLEQGKKSKFTYMSVSGEYLQDTVSIINNIGY